jgi:hypothetical protein
MNSSATKIWAPLQPLQAPSKSIVLLVVNTSINTIGESPSIYTSIRKKKKKKKYTNTSSSPSSDQSNNNKIKMRLSQDSEGKVCSRLLINIIL